MESALYAQARLRGEPVRQHPDQIAQRLLLTAQAEVAEAQALKNLRLHERRLQWQYEKDKAELNEMVHQRWKREERQREDEGQRRQEADARQRRQEQARQRAERRKTREAAAFGKIELFSISNGFEFSTSSTVTPGHSSERSHITDPIA